MRNKEDAENSHTSKKGYLWYTIDSQVEIPTSVKKKKKTMPVLSSHLSKKRLTAKEIEEKLTKAEKRRKERNIQRSARAVENREKMVELSQKIEKLMLHQEVSKQSNCSNNENILSKKEYCKTAAEVSMVFENLAKRYENDLATAAKLTK